MTDKLPQPDPEDEEREPSYWFCNSCGDEVRDEADDCCDDGEVEPSYDD